MDKSFEPVWQAIQKNLKPGTEVRNWTILKGYWGGRIPVVDLEKNAIIVQATRTGNELRVPRSEFEKMWKIWTDYKGGKVTRQEIGALMFVSKYVISILHWYEENPH